MSIEMRLNENQPVETATVFLEGFGTVYGSAEYQTRGEHAGKWLVTMSEAYDPETDSDCRFVGYFDDRQAAIVELESQFWTIR